MCTHTESISFEQRVGSYPEEGLVLGEYFGNLPCFAAIFAKNWCYDFESRSRLRALLLRQRKRSYTFFVGSVPCIQMAIYLFGIFTLYTWSYSLFQPVARHLNFFFKVFRVVADRLLHEVCSNN